LRAASKAGIAKILARNAEVASLATVLHRLETKFERQGVAMQAQLAAQQEEILELKADSRGKEQRIGSIETLHAQHAKTLASLSAQNGVQQMQIDHYSQRATKSGGGLQAACYELSDRTATEVDLVKADAAEMRTRLAQCEKNATPFVQMMERRRMQEETLCRGEGLTKMLATCCPSNRKTETATAASCSRLRP
jgi:hypothetical protein